MSKQVENYIFQQVLGQGQYGSVFKGLNKKTNEIVAVKQMNIEKFKKIPKLYDFIKNEIDILSNIDHQNVIRFIEILRTSNNFYLVYEYCNGGDLEHLLKKRKLLPESEANIILQQLISAFKVLVSKNILHRDLKPGNIIFNNNQVKVADFGFCKALETSDQMTKTMVGSPIYMAPEILKGYTYSVKADIWSIGVVYFEMLFGYCPFEDSTIQRLINQINQKPLSFPKNVNNISKNAQDLLKKMLVVDPHKRIEWDELINLVLPEKSTNLVTQPKYQEKSPRHEMVKKQIPQSAQNRNVQENKYFINQKPEKIFPINQLDNDQDELNNITIERYKVLFLINIMRQVNEFSNSDLGYELAIYLVTQAKIKIQKLAQKYFQKEQMSKEKKYLMKIISEEDKFVVQFQSYLIGQIPNKNIDANVISKFLQEVKQKLQTSDLSDQNNSLTLMKQLIDLKDIDNFFGNNLNDQCSYEQQSYFQKSNNSFLQDFKQKMFSMID